jgi:hypothetical protein
LSASLLQKVGVAWRQRHSAAPPANDPLGRLYTSVDADAATADVAAAAIGTVVPDEAQRALTASLIARVAADASQPALAIGKLVDLSSGRVNVLPSTEAASAAAAAPAPAAEVSPPPAPPRANDEELSDDFVLLDTASRHAHAGAAARLAQPAHVGGVLLRVCGERGGERDARRLDRLVRRRRRHARLPALLEDVRRHARLCERAAVAQALWRTRAATDSRRRLRASWRAASRSRTGRGCGCARRARAIAWWCRGKTSGRLTPTSGTTRPSALRRSARSGARRRDWLGLYLVRTASNKLAGADDDDDDDDASAIVSDSQNGNYFAVGVHVGNGDACTFNRPSVKRACTRCASFRRTASTTACHAYD